MWDVLTLICCHCKFKIYFNHEEEPIDLTNQLSMYDAKLPSIHQ